MILSCSISSSSLFIISNIKANIYIYIYDIEYQILIQIKNYNKIQGDLNMCIEMLSSQWGESTCTQGA
jgi:hypothetical protein